MRARAGAVSADCVSALKVLVHDTLPKALGNRALPSVDHCVGVHRLLGEDLGPAICEALGVKDALFTDRLTVLCGLMRSYVVLDDFLRDHGLARHECSEVLCSLARIGSESERLIRELDGKDSPLWGSFLNRYRRGNELFASHRPFFGVQEKCSFVFLPFEISSLQADPRIAGLKELVATYLFALQLMDDFHDIDEDRQNAVNQNLFLLQTDPRKWSSLSKNRCALAPVVVSYVSGELGDAVVPHASSIFGKYVHGSKRWLGDIAAALPAASPLTRAAVFPDGFPQFSFQYSELEDPVPGDVDYTVVERIRAENMHSACHDQR